MAESLSLLFFLLGSSLASGFTSNLKCFQCNSWVDHGCSSIQPNQTNSIYYKPCEPPEENIHFDFDNDISNLFCRKIEQKIPERENLVRIIRKCGWIKYSKHDCYKVENEDHIETVCQCFTDGCNNALTSKPTNILLVTMLYLVGIFFKNV